MTQGNPTKLLLSFMIPMVIGNFFQQLYNVIDSIVVGQVVGADALAAIGATSSLDFLFAISNNPYFKIEKKQFQFNYVIIKQCTRIGIPLAFQNSLIAFSCVALQSVVNTFGAVIVAAFTATSRIEQLVEQPYNSLGMSLATYTGQNVGANKIDRVKLGYRKALIIMLIYSFIMMPLAHYGGKIVVQMFVDEIQVIEYGAQALKITSCFYVFLGSIYVTRGLLNGAGDAAFAFINGIVEIFGRICFAFLLTSVVGMGAWGIWMSTSATWVLTSVFNITRYFQGKWKKKII